MAAKAVNEIVETLLVFEQRREIVKENPGAWGNPGSRESTSSNRPYFLLQLLSRWLVGCSSSVLEFNGKAVCKIRQKISVDFADVCYVCVLRTAPQLFGERAKSRFASGGVDFDATVPQISSVASQANFRSRLLCKVAVPDPLHPARNVIAFRPLRFQHVLLRPRDLRRKPRILPELAAGKHMNPEDDNVKGMACYRSDRAGLSYTERGDVIREIR